MKSASRFPSMPVFLLSAAPAICLVSAAFSVHLLANPDYDHSRHWLQLAQTDPARLVACLFLLILGALVLVYLANDWLRVAAGIAALALFLVASEHDIPVPLSSATGNQDWHAPVSCIFLGSGLVAVGLFHMQAVSYINRGIGSVAVGWGMAMISFSLGALHHLESSIFQQTPAAFSADIVILLTLMLLAAVGLAHAEHWRLQSSARSSRIIGDSERRMRLLAEAAQEAIVVERDGYVEDANAVFRKLVEDEHPVGQKLSGWLASHCRQEPVSCEDGDGATAHALLSSKGTRVPVDLHSSDMGDGRTVYAMRDLTEAHRKEERIRDLADNDALTGIANRRSFDIALHRAVRLAESGKGHDKDHTYLALIMLDLDRFKPVNDTYGHAVGDKLLCCLAARFRSIVRPDDLLARIGGDEFAVIAWLRDEHAGARLADRLCKLAGTPFTLDGININIGASAGFAIYRHSSVEANMEAFKQAADIALYRAKDGGGGKAVTFCETMRREAREKLQLENDVRQALERNDITLKYQPQHDLRSGDIIGFTAVLCWTHPTLGPVPMNKLAAIAEETGAIISLGRWAMNRAMLDMATLNDTARLAVPVWPKQLEASDILSDVKEALGRSGLAPHRLELEVGEQVIFKKETALLQSLCDLRDLGVNLTLGDFGACYDPMGAADQFPFTKVRLKRKSVSTILNNGRASTLVRSTIALAKALQLRVAVEGVNSHTQLLRLTQLSCDEAQGYLLGEPQPLCVLASTSTGSKLQGRHQPTV